MTTVLGEFEAGQATDDDKAFMNVLVGKFGQDTELGKFLAHLRDLVEANEGFIIYSKPAETPDEWDGFGSQRELLAATVYTVRAKSRQAMTPQRWERIKKMFPNSYRTRLEQADQELEDM